MPGQKFKSAAAKRAARRKARLAEGDPQNAPDDNPPSDQTIDPY